MEDNKARFLRVFRDSVKRGKEGELGICGHRLHLEMKYNFTNFAFAIDKTSFLCYYHTHKMKFYFIKAT